MKKEEIIKKLKSLKLNLEVHPDNEEYSEFKDSIDDLDEILQSLTEPTQPKFIDTNTIVSLRNDFIASFEGDEFQKDNLSRLWYTSTNGQHGINLEVYFDELIEFLLERVSVVEQEGVVSAEEVLWAEIKSTGIEVDENNFWDLLKEDSEDGLFARTVVKAMHTYASQTREEEMKKHAIKFARYYISNKSIIELNKDNDDEVYNEYLEQK